MFKSKCFEKVVSWEDNISIFTSYVFTILTSFVIGRFLPLFPVVIGGSTWFVCFDCLNGGVV